MSNYQKTEWKEFRQNILENDDYTCVRCGKTKFDGVTLQVHHTIYHKGRKPWQYATEECQTLCKGCHAAEHGIIIPKYGWEFVEMEDLEDLIGECEYCGNPLRYSFTIFHEKWGSLNVGTGCCDNLTDSDLASNEKESLLRYVNRRKIFLNSSRWKNTGTTHLIKQALFEIKINEDDEGFKLTIHGLKSDKNYESLKIAKEKVFDIIESGKLIEYCEKKKIIYPKRK
ncbi:HNH endonuclease [Flavobacterium helocola]|uniref:HNH endonuclease n=1 Tax=Flavobacterium helocola TaxID=3139139 RepID=A0ABU9I9D5_9FLAO